MDEICVLISDSKPVKDEVITTLSYIDMPSGSTDWVTMFTFVGVRCNKQLMENILFNKVGITTE